MSPDQQIRVVELAKDCVDKSRFQIGAAPNDAPGVVDCSSLMQWLYRQIGIELPRRAIEQWGAGRLLMLHDAVPGDLAFVKGRYEFVLDPYGIPIGHVGMVTDRVTIIHASMNADTVIETGFRRFNAMGGFQGVRRYELLNHVIAS